MNFYGSLLKAGTTTPSSRNNLSLLQLWVSGFSCRSFSPSLLQCTLVVTVWPVNITQHLPWPGNPTTRKTFLGEKISYDVRILLRCVCNTYIVKPPSKVTWFPRSTCFKYMVRTKSTLSIRQTFWIGWVNPHWAKNSRSFKPTSLLTSSLSACWTSLSACWIWIGKMALMFMHDAQSYHWVYLCIYTCTGEWTAIKFFNYWFAHPLYIMLTLNKHFGIL